MHRRRVSDLGKRLFDIVGGGLGLLLLSPILGIAGVLVRWRLGAPILFRQVRPGLHGRPFELLKLRTLKMDNAACCRQPAACIGLQVPEADRPDAIARFLRRSGIDELPQLLNVVRGDMSLVGPRPLMPRYLERYTPEQGRRHEVRPGITGWAQIHGRTALGWPERLARDVWYVDHRSVRLDVHILIRTVWQALAGGGEPPPSAEFVFVGSHGLAGDRCPVLGEAVTQRDGSPKAAAGRGP